MQNLDVQEYIKALKSIKNGNYDITISEQSDPNMAELGQLIKEVGQSFQEKIEISDILFKITEKVNQNINLEDVWNHIYNTVKQIIPYSRLRVTRILDNNKTVRTCWQKTDSDVVIIKKGFETNLEGSSLEEIIESGKPRIINDLKEYYKVHPHSETTKLVLEEGMQSSFSCPMYALNKPIGFLFFSSREKNTYNKNHIKMYEKISIHLSMVVKKSRMRQRLLELDELKNQFLGIAAHDLKSPINVIRSYVTLWKENYYGQYDGAQKLSLDIIERNGNRMIALIDDLLDLSAIESGAMQINKITVNFNELILNNYISNKSVAEKKLIELILNIKEELPEINIDPNRIYQAIDNYISNAIKYSPSETKIILTAEIIDEQMQVSVKDCGRGIPDDKLGILFTKFGKAGVRPTGKEKSTGLGLFIVQQIIEGHGGKVWVKSESGVGSTFYFQIPLI